MPGMSKKEPFIALGVAAVWGIAGGIYFVVNSKKTGRQIMLSAPPTATTTV